MRLARADRLAELYRAESARVVNLAYLLTGQRQLAEDIAQEAFSASRAGSGT